ncbi:MAG TPA: ATP-binding cassette domain-containing protein [Thermoanaerobaculia bacterium]|jgi:phospholipid/cholesterol/gamma-HCH transport system ATP-binding protein|nr:ATP-binding cassette domain-containing protein [Thermoanaerobaculia bacterium]
MARADDLPLRPAGQATAPGGVTIALRGVTKSFADKLVLDHIDLDVHEGESLVIVGGSGTGKSVLLKHMIGLLRPDSGTVAVDGVDLATLGNREITEFRRRFGMSFQEGALFDSLTVDGNIGFPLRRAGWVGERVRARVAECLDLVHLEGAGHKLPAELSGGMRRRVGFARAIALEPRILLLDEPTTGLDPVIAAVIEELVLELEERLDLTAVTITHDMESAFRIADRIGMLHKGRVIALAAPEEFRQLPDPRVQQFLRREAKGPLTEE